MANRFPIIVDSSGVPALKELASGDNLDLTGSGIVNAGTVAVTNLTVGGSQGTNGQILTSTGSSVAWQDAAGGGGAWNVISSQTIGGSAVSTVEFTSGITGYTSYALIVNNLLTDTNNDYLEVKFAYNGNSSYESSNYTYSMLYTNPYGTVSQQISNASSAMSMSANMSTTGPTFGKLWFGTGSSMVRGEFASKRGSDNTAYITTMGGFNNSSLLATSINKVLIRSANGDLSSGTFTLYGLANS